MSICVHPVVTFVRLSDLVQFFVDSPLSWEQKYRRIFSLDVSSALLSSGIRFDWVDPDGSYEDDVRAFAQAVKVKADELREKFGLGGKWYG